MVTSDSMQVLSADGISVIFGPAVSTVLSILSHHVSVEDSSQDLSFDINSVITDSCSLGCSSILIIFVSVADLTQDFLLDDASIAGATATCSESHYSLVSQCMAFTRFQYLLSVFSGTVIYVVLLCYFQFQLFYG